MSWDEAPPWLQRLAQLLGIGILTAFSFTAGDRLDLGSKPEPTMVERMEEVTIRLYRERNECELKLAACEGATDGHPAPDSQ